jgi:hypothetical protein
MRVLEALQKEFKPAPNTISAMMGMQLVAMPNQKADCWMISDPHLAKAYRNGDISEETLKRFYEMVSEIRLSQENVKSAGTDAGSASPIHPQPQ